MAQFKSYATRGAFNPTQVPDEVTNFKESREDKARSMERALNTMKETAEVGDNFRRSARQAEQQSARDSFATDTRAREIYRQQLLRNFATERENLEKEAANNQQTFNALKDFSQTAYAGFEAFTKGREAGMQEAFTIAVYESGITADEAIEIIKLDRSLSDAELGRNHIVQTLAERGVTLEQIRFIQQTGGSDRYLNNKALLLNTVSQFPMDIEQQMDEPFELSNGNTTTLSQAIESGDIAGFQEISGKLTRKWISENQISQFNPQLAGTIAFPEMHRYWDKLGTTTGTKARDNIIQEALDKRNNVRSQVYRSNAGGHRAVWDMVSQSPPGATRRRNVTETLNFFKNLAMTGQFTAGHLKDLNDVDVCTGANKTDCQKFEDRFRNRPEYIAIRDSIRQYQGILRQEFENNRTLLRQRGQQMEREVLNQFARDPNFKWTKSAKEQIIAKIRSETQYNPTLLEKFETKQQAVTNALDEQAEIRFRLGDLTMSWLEGTGDPAVLSTWGKHAKRQEQLNNPGSSFSKEEVSKWARLLSRSPVQIKNGLTVNSDSPVSAFRMELHLKGEYYKNLETILGGNEDIKPADAARQARDIVEKWFNNRYKGEKSAEQFTNDNEYLDMQPGGRDGDISSALDNLQVANDVVNDIYKAIEEHGNDVLNVPGTIYKNVAEIERASRGYGKENFRFSGPTLLAARTLSKSPHYILNTQREAFGLDPLELPQALQIIEDKISPQMLALMNRWGTQERIRRGLSEVGEFRPELVSNGYGDLVLQSAANWVSKLDTPLTKEMLAGHIAALGDAENSGINDVQANWQNRTSSAGAVGVLQIVPRFHPNYDPNSGAAGNIDYGTRFFVELLNAFDGDVINAVAAYNAGEARVREHLETGRPLPAETQEYIKKWENHRFKGGDTSRLRSYSLIRPTSSVREGARSSVGALTWEDNKDLYREVMELVESLGFRVGEHEERGGVAPVHAPNSFHKWNEAFDITHHDGKPFGQFSAGYTTRLKELMRETGCFKEVIGPGDNDDKHETHLHLGGLLCALTPAMKQRIKQQLTNFRDGSN